MRPPRISRCRRTITLPRTVPLCFSLLYEHIVLVSFLEQFVAGRPSYSSKENSSAQTSRCKRTLICRVQYLFVFPSCKCFLCLFLSSLLPGSPFTVRKMRPPRMLRCKRTINMPRTVPLCFLLLYMFFVSFLEQWFAGRRFYSKKIASAQNFAGQVDDKFAAYSTSLFFPPVHVFCALFCAVCCREALLQ